MASPLRRPKLAQRLGFDLTDTLARYVELLPDLFKSVLALAADAEAQANHFFFFRRQGLQNIGGFVADVRIDYGVHRRTHPAVFDQIAQRRLSVAAHRSF